MDVLNKTIIVVITNKLGHKRIEAATTNILTARKIEANLNSEDCYVQLLLAQKDVVIPCNSVNHKAFVMLDKANIKIQISSQKHIKLSEHFLILNQLNNNKQLGA